jgi:hypothetical protein
MSSTLEAAELTDFVDRRNPHGGSHPAVRERRQFGGSHPGLSPEAEELALAIDDYKLRHRRRFIDYEEILAVLKGLGYHR